MSGIYSMLSTLYYAFLTCKRMMQGTLVIVDSTVGALVSCYQVSHSTYIYVTNVKHNRFSYLLLRICILLPPCYVWFGFDS